MSEKVLITKFGPDRFGRFDLDDSLFDELLLNLLYLLNFIYKSCKIKCLKLGITMFCVKGIQLVFLS